MATRLLSLNFAKPQVGLKLFGRLQLTEWRLVRASFFTSTISLSVADSLADGKATFSGGVEDPPRPARGEPNGVDVDGFNDFATVTP
jgi:hypothetical protein